MSILRELGPLLVFFATYKFYGLIEATIALSIIMSTLLAYDYLTGKKIQIQMVVSTLILVIFTGISVLTGDVTFIKMKITIINLLFGIILFVGVALDKGFIKYLFGPALNLNDKSWIILSKRFGFFFILLSVVNEIIWRNFSEDIWVNFKTFGVMAITLCFALTQMSFMSKNSKESKEDNI
jgi:intracellular septation protein